MDQAVAPKLSLQTATTKSTTTPTMLVCVPRGVYAQYWPSPWANVMDAAKSGVDGLTIQHGLPPRYMSWEQDVNPAAQPDVAFLREGDGPLKGRTVLYQQNW
jgi:hypothetical protein